MIADPSASEAPVQGTAAQAGAGSPAASALNSRVSSCLACLLMASEPAAQITWLPQSILSKDGHLGAAEKEVNAGKEISTKQHRQKMYRHNFTRTDCSMRRNKVAEVNEMRYIVSCTDIAEKDAAPIKRQVNKVC